MLREYKSRTPPKLLMELRPSGISGIGVFAVRPIRKGLKIADGIAEEDYEDLVPWDLLKRFDRSIQKKIRDFCIGTPEGFIPPENLDFNKLSIEWYLNHSCNGNVGFKHNGDFVAIRNIKKGKELTYDYGLAESNPRFRMRCKCGSKKCRMTITGDDWKKEAFRKSRIAHMLPRLRGWDLRKGS
jgi:SET domain-containing protein